ncbi:MD-2-related lipid-recognition domain-containing protein [Auriculariales sp. MPI-PUGE-AT-0066]|nr:MD-2-related lipid-recognition domain-containing protein [Auriculariales sp. MPI-PUGE-AT-0066]
MLSTENIQVIDCGTGDDAFRLDSISATPYPPRSGENVTVEAVGTVLKPIKEGAFVIVTVKLGLIKVLNRKVDICEQVKESRDLECPLPEGEYTVKEEIHIPGVAPMGKYTIQARGFMSDDSEDVDLGCLDLKVQMLPARPGHFLASSRPS